jgi:predicted nucleic acid-binding protein
MLRRLPTRSIDWSTIADGLLILDDQLTQRIADVHGLRCTGTLGVLVKAKRAGDLSSVGSVVTILRAKGMWLKMIGLWRLPSS